MQKIRLELLRFLARKLIRFVTEDDVLRIVERDLYIGNIKMTSEEVVALKMEAREFKDSYLWKYVKRNIQYLATKKMGEQAKTRDDIFMGNAMYLNLETMEIFIDKVSKL